MLGRRVDFDDGDPVFGPTRFAPGDYGKDLRTGAWWVRPPRNADGRALVGRLTSHQVLEHGDGTITVSPSILWEYGSGESLWHGWLQRGEWTQC